LPAGEICPGGGNCNGNGQCHHGSCFVILAGLVKLVIW
jgi:hypothetical protein